MEMTFNSQTCLKNSESIIKCLLHFCLEISNTVWLTELPLHDSNTAGSNVARTVTLNHLTSKVTQAGLICCVLQAYETTCNVHLFCLLAYSAL